MLKTLIIAETEDTPRVLLDQENGKFEIIGRSFPEDASKFYAVVLRWLGNYIKEPLQETKFFFNLEYFNSSSLKQLIEILIKLEEIHSAGKKINVTWNYDKDDELMAAKGEEIQNMIILPFELKAVE